MQMLKLSSFAVFAVAVVAVWQVSSGAEATPSPPSVDYVRERPSRCGAKPSSDLAAMSTPTEGQFSHGPRTLEESGASAGTWGKCIDCSDCLGPGDCMHVGGPCYEFCP